MAPQHSTRPEHPAGMPDADPSASGGPHVRSIVSAADRDRYRAGLAGLVYVNQWGGVDRDLPLPIEVVAAAPEAPAAMIGLEARCTRCGETFNPNNETDLIHAMRDDETTECGGQGDLVGGWSSGPPDQT